MKKLLIIMLATLLSCEAFAQTNSYWFNPFSFYTQLNSGNGVFEQIARDTSGQIWFCGFDNTTHLVHVINQTLTEDRTLYFPGSMSNTQIFFDGNNKLWLGLDRFWYSYSAGIFTALSLPGGRSTYQYNSRLIADRSGIDYFLTFYGGAPFDSVFITRYDGLSYMDIYRDTISTNNSNTNSPYLICDNNGVLTFYNPPMGFMTFNQNHWNIENVVIDTLAFPVLPAKSGGYYFLGDQVFLIRKNGISLDTFSFPPAISHGPPPDYTVALGPDSNLWVITLNEGFYDLQNNGTWQYIPSPGFISNYNLWGAFSFFPALFDRDGRMWTIGGGSNPPNIVGVYSFIPFNSISGRVFYDVNSNGVADGSDLGFTPINIIQSTNGCYANTDTDGNYDVTYIDSSIAHILSATTPSYYHFTTPSSYVVGAGGPLCCFDFGVHADATIQDLNISVASSIGLPGYPSSTWICYGNFGTVAVSDTISYIFDSLLHFQQADPTPTVISGHTLKWAYSSLSPFHSNKISVLFQTDVTAAAGDTLISTAAIYPLRTDTSPANNVFVNHQPIKSSYDPNIKTVKPSSGISPGQKLTYTVYFQNTGTAPAVHITVLDTLDANLDPASFRLLGSSSSVNVSLKTAGVLSFELNNVYLPDSASDPAGSVGFIQFTVDVFQPLKHAASAIPNTAFIYFDFNWPVQTNIAKATISITNIPDIISPSAEELKISPNPSAESITVQSGSAMIGGMLIIYDYLGKVVYSGTFDKDKMQLDVSAFSVGVYLVRMTKNGLAETTHLVKR